MKKQSIWISLLFAATAIPSCVIDDNGPFGCEHGEGPTVSRELDVPPFTGVKLECSADVFIKQGPEQLVLVEGQDNVIDQLEQDVQNGTWEIEFDDCVRNYKDLKITIIMPEISLLYNSSSGDIKGLNQFTGDFLVLRNSGSGDLEFNVDYATVDADLSGSGDLELKGAAEELNLDLSGSGDFFGFDFPVETATVDLSGSGDVEVNVIDLLDIDLSGSGDIYYQGNPILSVKITGSGELKEVN